MRVLRSIVILLVSGFLIVWGAYRLALELAAGVPLEPLPFISGGLGLVGLLLVIVSTDALLTRRSRWREHEPSTGSRDGRRRDQYSREE